MINLFVTYRCNLACPYCFARSFARSKPGDLSREDFLELLDWMVRAGLDAAGFLGGEPTLHPDLAWMTARAAEAGVRPVVFTNGTCGPELARELAASAANFVVNYNDPSLLTSRQQEALHATLDVLKAAGARITFSKNFSEGASEYAYLLEGVRRYGVRAVRYDISRPDVEHANDHFREGETASLSGRIVAFVRACQKLGVRTGLDCCARLCDFSEEDRLYLEKASMKFRGVCHPSVDVHPDLSASYCLPLGDVAVARVTAFSGWDPLIEHFASLVRPLRALAANTACGGCDQLGRRCQGGCLALARIPSPLSTTTQHSTGASLP